MSCALVRPQIKFEVDPAHILIVDVNLARKSRLGLEYRVKAPLCIFHSLHSKQQHQKAGKVLNKVDAGALNCILMIKIPDVNDAVWHGLSI